MRLEIAERLICPHAHVRTPLIIVAQRTRDRDLLDAELGCMTCHRKAQVMNGHALLQQSYAGEAIVPQAAEASAALDRLEAQLGLAEPGARVLLGGRYALYADLLAERVQASVAALNVLTIPAPGVGSVFLAEAMVPFSDATFTAAAFDTSVNTAQLTDALRTLQRGARIVGMLPLPVPVGVRELARDAVEWVGERDALPGDVVPLRRA